ncbi:alpha/beta fold hydrolase [Rhizobium leguminosarum]|uniref:alpha/beta fold hydrolase n=1 Tax=Rhizobium leguminosarum TaxID=384 RepID=UPI0018AD50D0|nr:alpha/beta hydrolase [Rhizobium leguminosarum]
MTKKSLEAYLKPRIFDVRVSDQQVVRAYEVGPPDVPLVVGIHGTPNTGLAHVACYVANAPLFCRLITFDRQGYGGSTPEPGRKVTDIVHVVEAVLDHLGAGSAALYGHSGGGMLALAAAALIPKRVSKAACVSGNGPNTGSGGFDYTQGPSPLMQEEIVEARNNPAASREFYRRVAAKLLDPEIERQLYSENDMRVGILLAPLREKLARELELMDSPYSEEEAYVDDAQSWAAPWGFELGSIAVPTRFFYGLDDLMVARHHSEWMRSQIPNAGIDLFPHYGHSLSQLMPYVLAWLVSDSLTPLGSGSL